MTITIRTAITRALADLRAHSLVIGEPLDGLSDDDLLAWINPLWRAAQRERAYAELARDYQEWMQEQGLSLGAAEAHLCDESLAAVHREWLRAFYDRCGEIGEARGAG
jgi:hypothetical protein